MLNRYATPIERLYLLLGLNCGFGTKEIATLTIGEIFLHQALPADEQEVFGFRSTNADSFVSLVRNKTTIVGKFLLFPQTVQMLEWALARRFKLPNVSINSGDFLAIMGRSGSGKSTFMNILGALDRPDSGRYILAGEEMDIASEQSLARFRNHHIGFVFQSFNLIPGRTLVDNVSLPLMYADVPSRQRREMAIACLNLVGLADMEDRRPHQLSGGQQQRVAIARAIVGNPTLVLADEPTGSLDSTTAEEIMD